MNPTQCLPIYYILPSGECLTKLAALPRLFFHQISGRTFARFSPRFSLCFPCPIVYNKLNLIDSTEKRKAVWQLVTAVRTKEVFKKAYEGGYAIGAFNVNNMEIIQGITEAAMEKRAPLILQVSKGARAYAKHVYLMKLVEAAIMTPSRRGFDLPICLHLDHGDTFELCKSCIDGGFTSVMIDGSHQALRGQHRADQAGRRVRARSRRRRRGRAGHVWPASRTRSRFPHEDSSYTRPEEVRGVRLQDRRGLPGHRHRHQPRRL